MKAQQPKGNSGTKAPRKHDYKPAPADVQEAHQIHVVEEDPDLPEAGHEAGTVRGHGQGGPGLSAGPSGLGGGGDGGPAGAAPKEPGLPDIVVTPSTPKVFSRPRQSQRLLYKHLCNSFIHSVGHSVMVCENIFMSPPRPKLVEDGAFCHKIDHFTIFEEILNLEWHPNCITGLKVTGVLLNGWILPIGQASAVKGLRL